MATINRKELNVVAKELNTIVGIDPPLEFGKKIKDADLQTEIEGCLEMVEAGDVDEFTKAAWKTLGALGCEVAAPKEEKKPARGKKAADKKPVEKKAAPKAASKPRYTRADAFAEAVSSNLKDEDKIIGKANDLYVKNGGKDNLAEARWFHNIAKSLVTRLDKDAMAKLKGF